MNTVLSFTDGSSYAASVYDHAVWASKQLNTSLRVVHTLNPHREKAALADFSGNIGPEAYDSLMNDLVNFDRERARLAQVKGEAILSEALRHIQAAGIQNVDTELRHGLFVDVLEDIQNNVDLIIIGKRGVNHAIAMKHLGTNIERTLRVAKCPVLVSSRAFKPIKRCLLAYDGGPSSQKALAFLKEHPLCANVEIDVLRVGRDDDRNRNEVQDAAEALNKAGFTAKARIREGEPAKVITDEVENVGFDLLAMGAYGHSRAKRMLIGSTTATLARDCHVPILMFR
ncbi:universal stress protein [Pelagicoccus sp. NFK12]|uniref:Universal stress protein n=1 Tax=Pelagicoccus enzymogenes TaxID=2773457 RepID=A0A927F8T9_9BACT|nr:universal stress protein [Pelagicoccus enzymogenes]MBD5779995.1 universal stress protein [Pelagicoccus enzymogenes]MDQ8198565.1 universal stress protein [Pelagicoccus enzymogenes]